MTRYKREAGQEKLAAAARAAGVADQLVLDAMRHTPRAAFVPAAYAARAYDDGPVPIPRHQVTTQPSLCATMIAALRLDGTQQVLEVGTGYGYQTALLAGYVRGHCERWDITAVLEPLQLLGAKTGQVQVHLHRSPLGSLAVSMQFELEPAACDRQAAGHHQPP